MITFSHAGKMGDVLSSLYFCLETASSVGEKEFNYCLQINKQSSDFSKYFPADGVLLTREKAEFIRPLLESQPYIGRVLILEETERGFVDLNYFRNGYVSLVGGEIRDWYYTFSRNTLPREFWKKILFVEPDPSYRDKILFSLTERYVNRGIDYMALKEFRDHLVFIGTDSEYQTFRSRYFELDRAELKPEDSLLTVARWLAGAKGFMSNQSGFFSLAELMKINRVLLPPDWIREGEGDGSRLMAGPKNNLPLGGWANSVSFTPKMVDAVKELIRM